MRSLTATTVASDEAVLADRMRRAQAGDRAAYAQVLQHCQDVFERLARERRPTSASDEVVRQCLLTVHRARHTFDPGRSFSAWIEAVARHHGIGPDLARGARSRSTLRASIGSLFRGLLLQVTPAAGLETSRAGVGHREGATET